MSNKKMTKREHYEQLKTRYSLAQDDLDFVNHELELLDKKNSIDKKPTAQQTANKGVADGIVDFLASNPNKMYTITELIKLVPACAELTNQRVSAIVKQMIGVSVERVEDKRKAYFKYLAE